MTLLQRGLSTPFQVLDPRVIAFGALTSSFQTMGTFLNQSRPHLEAAGAASLGVLLTEWMKPKSQQRLDTVWEPVFGDMRRMVRDKVQQGHARPAAALGLKLHAETRIEGEWSLSLGEESRLLWGPWFLPLADWISVRVRADEVSLKLRQGGATHHVEGRFSDERWTLEGAQRLVTIEDPRLPVTFLPASALIGPEYDDIRPEVAEAVPEAFRQAWSEALDLLGQHVPRFLPWVTRFLRFVIPLRSDNEILRSNSNLDHPGQIQMSLQANPAAIAEMMIHESSHQHYLLAHRLGVVHDGSDPTLYWSPVRQKSRHIRYILFAYHAFGNVMLYYRACRAAGLQPADRYFERGEPNLLPQLEELEQPLRNSKALTQLGRNLYEPLRDHLHG